ncbi:phenylalanine--tRNA ligase subunit beta [Sodalis-like secondary symbiont of Drepanosiphum platanoidis]|uniref:phenylalanine--tRNA ligase subunit beta n=1 Tax=Sodalis-like secondary symbiont of Drepanosiphum platanoidis TaxID=2994493 RepID=UPI0034648009
MKFSEFWLREFIKIKIDRKTLINQLTINAGLEVESIKPVSINFKKIVIGKVINCIKNKDIKNKYIINIDIASKNIINIISNFFCKKNTYVVVAKSGAILPSGKIIKTFYNKNYISEGILCSFFDIGIYEYSNILIELPNNSPIGYDFYKYFKLNDYILKINTPHNRSDTLSLLGIARELSAINNCSIINYKKKIILKKNNDKIKIKIKALEACPNYTGRIINNVNLKVNTPLWMKEKLRRSDLYSNNLINNITNYVLLELGQPIQIFFKNFINKKLIIRMAKKNEKFIFNKKKIIIKSSNTLVISDNKKILTIAGISNNLKLNKNCSIYDLLITSAFFNPKYILKNFNQYKLKNSPTLDRYIKGIDPSIQIYAIEHITDLFIKICGGEPGPIINIKNKSFFKKEFFIKFNRKNLYNVLGYYIPNKKIKEILNNLGYKIKKINSEWKVKIPKWRFDIKIKEDLIEDIARIYGYDNISKIKIKKLLNYSYIPKENNSLLQVKNLLINRGYQEIITYSFVNPKIQNLLHPKIKSCSILNPISKEMSVMRVSLLTGLINTLIYNYKRQQKNIRLFESGLRFIPNLKKKLKVQEDLMLSGIIFGERFNEHWDLPNNFIDFYDIKGDLEDIFQLIGILENIELKKTTYSFLHPKKSAKIYFKNKLIGYIGMIHPFLEKKFDLNNNIFVFEFIWKKFFKKQITKLSNISRFPYNRRDISIILKENISASEIINECKKINENKLIDINLFDIYRGKNIKNGFKSFSISFILQSYTHTLKENEITLIINKYISILKKKFQVFLRD